MWHMEEAKVLDGGGDVSHRPPRCQPVSTGVSQYFVIVNLFYGNTIVRN